MSDFEKDEPKYKEEAAPTTSPSKTKHPRQFTKKEAMIKLFIKRGRRGLNCFEAANFHKDYVLRSTVSDLHRDYGLEFAREWEKVPNAFGKTTDCVRYWLDESNISKAIALLDGDKNHGSML